MLGTTRENTTFVVWFLMLMACVGLGAAMATWQPYLVLPGIMLSFVFMWLTSFVPAAGPMYKALSNQESWPCSPRMLLGLLVGGMTVIYVIASLTVGWTQ